MKRLFIILLTLAAASAQTVNPSAYRELKFRYIRPVGNRISAVAGVPGNFLPERAERVRTSRSGSTSQIRTPIHSPWRRRGFGRHVPRDAGVPRPLDVDGIAGIRTQIRLEAP